MHRRMKCFDPLIWNFRKTSDVGDTVNGNPGIGNDLLAVAGAEDIRSCKDRLLAKSITLVISETLTIR